MGSGFLRRTFLPVLGVGATATLAAVAVFPSMPSALASVGPVGLGTATPFAVLAGTTVTNTGPSHISGDLGVSPGTAVTGFPPGKVVNGKQHRADAVALQAQSDLTTAYNDAAGRTPATTVKKDLGGQRLSSGIYKAASAMALTGTVTLDAKGNPNAVFIFQAGSTLITASNATVALTGGAQSCNVFWQVGSSATLGTDTTFAGTVMALTSISVKTGTTVAGRVLARNGQVSLDDNVITESACSTGSTTTTTTLLGSGTTTTTSPGSSTTTTTLPSSATTTTTLGSPTTTTVPTKVPKAHTGEPWAARSYWLLVGATGLVGAGLIERALWLRRRRS